jgi:hypothetical protein
MEKIIKALLEAKYPTVDVASLLEIVNATPNASLATEIICGLYEPPIVSFNSVMNNAECQYVRYDKWEDRVHYKYMKNKMISMYVTKGFDTSVITVDNYKEHQVAWSSRDTESFYLTTDEMVEESSSTHLENWQSKAYEPAV